MLAFCLQTASLVEQTATNKDPYFGAMVAETLYKVGRKEEAGQLARRLQTNQVRNGPYRTLQENFFPSGLRPTSEGLDY